MRGVVDNTLRHLFVANRLFIVETEYAAVSNGRYA